MSLLIDGKEVEFTPGETVLSAAGRAGIAIPHLCAMDWACKSDAACRVCLVEVEQVPRLLTSCTLEAKDGQKIKTRSPRVQAVRRNIVELLIANHPNDCLVCERNQNCELAKVASELGVRERRYRGLKKNHPIDISSPALVRDPNKCILCGRCVTACHQVQGVGAIDFIGRGIKTRVGPGFHEGINVSSCIFCGQCTRVCPTAALMERSQVEEVVKALGDPQAFVVAQIAPAVPATLMERAQASSVKTMLLRLAAALKHIGFAAVFDTGFAADLTIMEEVSELIKRVQTGGPLPMFTSCSPGWIEYVEKHRPDLIPHLSTCKSPQQMAAALIKEVYPKHRDLGGKRLVCVSLMPCTAKKVEASTLGDVDFVLTTREIEQLLERFGIAIETMTAQGTLDPPFSSATGAGRLFGGTGGVMEAAVRTAHKMLTGRELEGGFKVEEARGLEGLKSFSLEVGGTTLNFGIVNGLGRLKPMLDPLQKGVSPLHFIEVMTCPGGCIGGGGQPYHTDPESIRVRIERIYDADRRATVKVAHDNEEVRELYRAMLGKPLGELSHQLLHRHYVNRRHEEASAHD
ncbi:MAG: [FeFe] hydrogenase, group A [Polyangia bacterium]|jgi:NADH-quinone oxidoreductase subunit G/NADP-reducing hydrogenase subunit HndD